MSAFLAPWRGRLIVVALVMLLVAVTAANYQFALRAPGGNSFLSGWMAVRVWLVDGGSPYDPAVEEEAQALLYGRQASQAGGEDPLAFPLPLPATVLYMPFALAPYPLARALWMTLLEVSLPLLALLGMRLASWRPSPGITLAVLLFSIAWYHGVVSIVGGDLAPLEGLLIGGWLWADTRRRDVLAALLLAGSTIRPEIVWLLIPLAIASAARSRRWVFLAVLLGTLSAVLAVSLLLQPGWPLPWLWRLLETQEAVGLEPGVMVVTGGTSQFSNIAALALGGILALYAGWEWVRARRLHERGLIWATQIVLLVSLWIAPQRSTAAFVVLIPAFVLLWGAWDERRARRSSLLIGALLVLVTAISWGLYLATAAQAAESPLLLFPIPSLALFGLWWIRRWATRPTLPTLEPG